MKNYLSFILVTVVAANCTVGNSQTLTPLPGFGVTAPGWLAPGDHGFNNNSVLATVRGIAYHSPSNRLIVVDRLAGLNVRILDAETGVQVHVLNSSIVADGFFIGNMVDVDDAGNVYMGNLSITASNDFRIYRWSSDAVQNLTNELPTIAYAGVSGRGRAGDSFSVIGSGANTRIVTAGGNLPGDSAFARFTTLDGLNFSLSNAPVVGNDVGAFRLSIDLDGAGSVLGNQTSDYITIAPETGGLAQTSALTFINQSIIAYDPASQLLATVQSNNNEVRLYDASDLSNLVFLDIANLTTSFVANGNGVGAASFGVDPNGDLRLYALNTNNGIQAFQITTPATGASIVNQYVVHGGWSGVGSAVDTGKVLHKQGTGPTTLAYANLINTSRGINALGFDIQDLLDPAGLNAADFEFQVSPAGAFDESLNPPIGWILAPPPSSITVVGSNPSQVLIEWPDNSIVNRWLRVTVKATANTGLLADETFYVGHLLGETTGATSGVFSVTFGDLAIIRAASGATVNASSEVDVDKNGTVSLADVAAARSSVGSELTAITVP